MPFDPRIPTVRRKAVLAAAVQWAHAPSHVKIMAGAYVAPILDALQAVSAELDARAAADANADGRAL